MRRVDELLGRIDDVAPAVCGWCSAPLDPGAVSLDFCGPGHQQLWQEHHQQAEKISAYREAADRSPTDAVQYTGDAAGPGSFNGCDCGQHPRHMPSFPEFESALVAIPRVMLREIPGHVIAALAVMVDSGLPCLIVVAPHDTPAESPFWRDFEVCAVTVRFHPQHYPAVPRRWWRRLVKMVRHR